MKNEDIIKKWLSGELSKSERDEFESSEAFAQIDKLLKAVNNFKSPGYDVKREYTKLSDNLFQPQKTITLYSRLNPLFRIAAILIVAVILGYFSYTYINQRINNQDWIAEVHEVYLPDSSVVTLNASAKIRFDEKNWRKTRNIELEGEAFFKVNKGSQFNVISSQGTVTVLGTEFDVKNWDNYFEVTCYSGSVKVITSNHEVILKPNMAFRIINGKQEQYTVLNKPMPDWINGESSFESVPLKFVLEELERQYNINTVAAKVDMNQLFTGSFSHHNLEIALKSVTVPLNLSYRVNENKIVLSAE